MMRKPLLAAILCALIAVFPAWAQTYKDSGGTIVPGVVPIPATVGGTASLAVTSSSGTVAIPASNTTYPSINLTNSGTTALYYALGASATTSSAYLAAGASVCIAAGSATTVAAITASSTTTLQITQTNSCLVGLNGGGGGGGGASSISPTTAVTGIPSGDFLFNNSGFVGGSASSSSIAFPQATTGGVSGGIPYFSSTTQLSASALLASGSLMTGGGAATAPSTFTLGGDCTFSVPNITCTETGGVAFGALATLTPGTGVATALGDGVNTNGGPLTGSTAGVAAGAVVLGAGSATAPTGLADVAVGSVLASGGTATNPAYSKTPQLGASGTLGSVAFGNATSGLLTLEPATGALGTITEFLPIAGGDTLAAIAATQTLTNKSIAGSEINSGTVPIAQIPTGTSSTTVPLGGVITAGGPTGSATVTPVITYNAAGQLTAVTTATIAPPYTALPALSANQVLGALTATTPSGQSVPSCSAANDALNWTSGTGFGCVTISGGGGVSSVGFTGGLISVATPTTTPAFTVAGTSGGIPYFSSATTWATSAALAANAIVIGGGAATAPSTTTTGTGVVTAIGDAVNTNGGLQTGTTASVAAGAIELGAGSGTAATGLADVATGSLLASGGVGSNPAYSTTPQLGASGTLGSLAFGNATSGLLTIEPQTGALGTVTVSIPAATDTLVNLAGTQTLSNKTLASPTVTTAFTATGLVTNADLANPATTVNGTTCTLGSTCTVTTATVATNAQTGTTYAPLSSDVGKLLTFTNAASIAVTLTDSNFSAGNFFNAIVLPSSVGPATFTPSSGTITCNNATGASCTLAPGSPGGTFVYDGTNWAVGGTGSLVTPPLPSTGNDTQLYPLWTGITPTVGSIAPTQNVAHCAPFVINQPMHLDQLLMDVTTLGTGPIAVALYTDAIDATKKVHQPQTLESSSSLSFIVTTATTVSVSLGSAGTGIPIPAGMNWVCTNDATATDAVRYELYPINSTVISSLIGSATAANVLSGTQVSALGISETSGTWPSFVGSTFSDQTAGQTIMMAYRVASAP